MPFRYFLRLSYQGTSYHGWQVQPNAVTVQQRLNESLALLLKQEVETVGCGRTDSGVHARQFYAHFDSDQEIAGQDRFLHSLNAILPIDIAVQEVIVVSAEAHARFDATTRSYEYHIHLHKDPFVEGWSYHYPFELDLNAMNQACTLLLTHRDFSCFEKKGGASQGSECVVIEAHWKMKADKLVFTITANRFLRNMVRAIVGTMLEVGHHKLGLAEFEKLLQFGQRSDAGVSVPAHGLYLVRVTYPYIPEKSEVDV